MRQGQQNRRGRGRGSSNGPSNNNNSSNNNNNNSNNNNRKPQNSLSRSYESSGPDVKIRGTAAQIAEKYIALARDASSSGDSVMAENYLQHAEHYNRIIMAAQAQVQAQPVQPVGYHQAENVHALNGASHRPHAESNGMMRDQPQPRIPSHQAPQPSIQPVVDIAEVPEPAPAPKVVAPREVSPPPVIAEIPKEEAPKEEPAAEPDTGRRRRRRYPAGTTRATAGAAEAGNANGKAVEAAPDDGRSSDEALA